MHLSYWICAAVTAASAFVSLGFAIAALITSTQTSAVASRYAFVRSTALALGATVGLFAMSVPFLAGIALTMTLVQAGDASIGVSIRDRVKTIGPAITALINLAALTWVLAG